MPAIYVRPFIMRLFSRLYVTQQHRPRILFKERREMYNVLNHMRRFYNLRHVKNCSV